GALLRETEVVASLAVARVQLHGLPQRGERPGRISRPPPRGAEVIPRVEEVGTRLRRLLELGQGLLGAALLAAHEAEAVPRLGQARREREGMLVGLGRAGQVALLLPLPAQPVAGQRSVPRGQL